MAFIFLNPGGAVHGEWEAACIVGGDLGGSPCNELPVPLSLSYRSNRHRSVSISTLVASNAGPGQAFFQKCHNLGGSNIWQGVCGF